MPLFHLHAASCFSNISSLTLLDWQPISQTMMLRLMVSCLGLKDIVTSCPPLSAHKGVHWNGIVLPFPHHDSLTKHYQPMFLLHVVTPQYYPKGISTCCEWPLRHQMKSCWENSWCLYCFIWLLNACDFFCMYVFFIPVSLLFFLLCNIVTVNSSLCPLPPPSSCD